jgi:hypothetical protein
VEVAVASAVEEAVEEVDEAAEVSVEELPPPATDTATEVVVSVEVLVSDELDCVDEEESVDELDEEDRSALIAPITPLIGIVELTLLFRYAS